MKPKLIKTVIRCKRCGQVFPKKFWFKAGPRLNWQVIKWAMGLGLVLEFFSNLAVYWIFK